MNTAGQDVVSVVPARPGAASSVGTPLSVVVFSPLSQEREAAHVVPA
jgi:hypothetical protein